MSVVLGIDIGTQSVKVVFYDLEARDMLAVESAPLDLYQTDDGVAEQQAHWWLKALQKSLQQVGADVRQKVAAIGVSGQQHGFVAVDAAGEVLAPVKLWCDTSTGAECTAIMDAAGGPARCIELAGNPIPPGYTASKVRWLRDQHPGAYAQMARIMLPHDYLNFYLTGVHCMEAGDASGTGFFDVRARQWSSDILAAIDPNRDLADCLPDVRTGNEVIGTLLPSVADELGLPADIAVAPGGGDNMMGAIGTGNVQQGVVTMSLGTSGTVYAYADTPIVDPNGNIAAFCSSTGGWLPLLCTMNCTVSSELMRSLIECDIAGFEAKIDRASRGCDGVITVPFFNGERTPNLPHAKGCIFGLDSRNTTPENLLRSSIEGATFALRFGIGELSLLGLDATDIVLTGGGANSPLWRQIVADICNAPVSVLQHNEGAAFGAALQAASVITAASVESLVAEHVIRDVDHTAVPRSSAVNFYNDAYNDYQRAVAAVAGLYG